MSEETRVSGTENVDEANIDYIEALKEMKENTVSKEEYAKLREENKRLLNSLINGETIEVEQETPVDIDEIRRKLFDADSQLTNLEYNELSLKLRDAVLAEGGRDPFLPCGTHVTVTPEMIEKAQMVADVIQECIDVSNGDDGVFTAHLQRHIKDSPFMRRGR